VEGEWRMDFSRPLSQEEVLQLEELLNTLQNTHLNESRDEVRCILEKSGKYSTNSMYSLRIGIRKRLGQGLSQTLGL
jgi:hypothetical protein